MHVYVGVLHNTYGYVSVNHMCVCVCMCLYVYICVWHHMYVGVFITYVHVPVGVCTSHMRMCLYITYVLVGV